MSRSVLSVLAIALATAAAGSQAQPPSNADAIRALIGDAKGVEAPGCAIGLYRDGKVEIYASGSADIAKKLPINGETQFYAASVSKQFTALAISQLVAAGKVGLDDDVRKFIPELPAYKVRVTVAMLLHHTGGIRDFLALGSLAGYENSGSMTREEALRLVLAQRDTNFEPGTQHDYSNGGYLLLSEIVERVSGEPFASYVNSHIFKPLGMKRSYVMAGIRAADSNVAHGYEAKDGGFVLRDAHPLFGGAGGVMFTANDLAKYDGDLHVGHRVWTPAVTKVMLAPGTLSDGTPARVTGSNLVYAGGLMLYGDWVEHGGAAEGYRTSYAFLPGRKLGLAVLCNRNDVAPLQKVQQILKAVDPSRPAPAITPIYPAGLNGHYVSDELPVAYELKAQGSKLTVTIKASAGERATAEPIILYRAVDGSYLSENRWTRIAFDASGNGFEISTLRATGIHFRRAD